MLSTEEHYRFNRHIIMPEIGLEGQVKLKKSSILVIGAGGLGCPILMYLSAAGIGRIGIMDDDVVDSSNLQRQVLYRTSDIGINKAKAATEILKQANPFITIDTYEEKLTSENALALFRLYDIIIDGSDNFATRYLVNDAAVICDKPLIYGAIHKFEGQVSVFNFQNTAGDLQSPTYRCLYPEPPSPESAPNCSEIGVLGVLPGLIGTMQANEALKLILGYGEVLSGKILMYDARNMSQYILKISPNEEQYEKAKSLEDQFEETDYDFFCGLGNTPQIQTISWKDLTTNHVLIDIRELDEEPMLMELRALRIPQSQLNERINEIPSERPVAIFCQSGTRSEKVIALLQEEHQLLHLQNISGGLQAYLKNKIQHG